MLEIAIVSCQHIAYFAALFPSYRWLTSEYSELKFEDIIYYRSQLGVENVEDPMKVDVHQQDWKVTNAEVVLAINMIHASTPEAAPALFKGAYRALSPGGLLIIYGPFKFKDGTTAPSNLTFDTFLRQKNPNFGLWFMEDIINCSRDADFSVAAKHPMPANNHLMVFRREL